MLYLSLNFLAPPAKQEVVLLNHKTSLQLSSFRLETYVSDLLIHSVLQLLLISPKFPSLNQIGYSSTITAMDFR